ncbi:large ribosomal subunit protein bL35m isoform X2 [Salarias fasciatus]|uniref:large ribosomal subunit protein bL35m isoform X2 n=1 Tax=Salarias fasciatus TaxID=181472 RepID=UPI0011767ECC|nr:39S ribosomal protein L35, mitochondrial isoform X2 [Salarias fasciatus]
MWRDSNPGSGSEGAEEAGCTLKRPAVHRRTNTERHVHINYEKPCRENMQTWPERVSALVPGLTQQPCRTLTYFSLRKGKRKSVKSVPDRFMRLHCGLWIRRKAGYKKKLWKKLPERRKRLREIVFCNKTQSKLLDKMTTSFWRRRNWYVDDPYLKYHDRVNLKV